MVHNNENMAAYMIRYNLLFLVKKYIYISSIILDLLSVVVKIF